MKDLKSFGRDVDLDHVDFKHSYRASANTEQFLEFLRECTKGVKRCKWLFGSFRLALSDVCKELKTLSIKEHKLQQQALEIENLKRTLDSQYQKEKGIEIQLKSQIDTVNFIDTYKVK